jgi:hypothetical protein
VFLLSPVISIIFLKIADKKKLLSDEILYASTCTVSMTEEYTMDGKTYKKISNIGVVLLVAC